jgi:hypothetical protein
MPHYRVEKICSEYMKFQKIEKPGENVIVEGMSGDHVFFVSSGMIVS